MRSFPQWDSPRIFPAIDLRDGRCVRCIQGDPNAELHYDEDPVKVAKRWEEEGASCLHVVDLGAAFGEASSVDAVLAIASAVKVPVQTGGGIRDEERIAALLDGGVARVILGTRALADSPFLARAVQRHGDGSIMVSLDCKGERLKVSGWGADCPLGIQEAIQLVEGAGVRRLLVTATDRDGTFAGPRVDLVRRILEGSRSRVVAAGGIGSLEHIQSVLAVGHPRLEGIVVGRALHEGKVVLGEALKLTREKSS